MTLFRNPGVLGLLLDERMQWRVSVSLSSFSGIMINDCWIIQAKVTNSSIIDSYSTTVFSISIKRVINWNHKHDLSGLTTIYELRLRLRCNVCCCFLLLLLLFLGEINKSWRRKLQLQEKTAHIPSPISWLVVEQRNSLFLAFDRSFVRSDSAFPPQHDMSTRLII